MAVQNFVEDFIRGLQAGQQQKEAQQAEADKAEDRSLRKMMLQHELRRLAIDEKMAKRGLAKENFALVDGQPESAFPITDAGFKPGGQPGSLNGMALPGQSLQLQATRNVQPMEIPGVEELGVGGVSMTPRTMEEVVRAQTQAKLAEPFNLPSGGARFVNGQKVAENPRPETPEPTVTIRTVEGGREVTKVIPRSQAVNQSYPVAPRRAAGSGGGAPAGGSSSLVDTVMANPAMYHTLTPTTREKIAPALAARGFTQFEKSSKPNDSVNEAAETAAEVRRIAKTLREHPGLPGVFGTISSRLPTFRQSTADAEVLLESLQGLLTLDNMGKMKGVLSDSDMKILRQASTTLSAKMSEAAAKTELLRLETVLNKVAGVLDVGAAGSNTNKIGRFEVEIIK
jgi:hypothetical protein